MVEPPIESSGELDDQDPMAFLRQLELESHEVPSDSGAIEIPNLSEPFVSKIRNSLPLYCALTRIMTCQECGVSIPRFTHSPIDQTRDALDCPKCATRMTFEFSISRLRVERIATCITLFFIGGLLGQAGILGKSGELIAAGIVGTGALIVGELLLGMRMREILLVRDVEAQVNSMKIANPSSLFRFNRSRYLGEIVAGLSVGLLLGTLYGIIT